MSVPETKSLSLEEAALAMGGPRIKYSTEYEGALPDEFISSGCWKGMAKALALLEELEAAPVAPDGKIAGNGAMVCPHSIGDSPCMMVSKSGKGKGEPMTGGDFAVVTAFENGAWRARYRSVGAGVKPSSDSPLLWHALMEAPRQFGWGVTPVVALHGHRFETEAEANALGLPISREETLFSTPEDRDALAELLQAHPYPKSQTFIRKGHGFFILAQDADEACRVLGELIEKDRAVNASKTGKEGEAVEGKRAAEQVADEGSPAAKKHKREDEVGNDEKA